MNPAELNTVITALNNYFFCALGERGFIKLALFLSLLSREMLSMEEMRRICEREEKRGHDSRGSSVAPRDPSAPFI